MTRKEIDNKVGAMHFRFLDDEESYDTLLGLLADYADRNEPFGTAVTAALEDGLQNIERYISLENALSPRGIVIEQQKLKSKRHTEGAWRIVLVMDDESRHPLHFGRKQDQLLYMLMLLCSQKSGLLSDFFRYERGQTTPVQETVMQLISLIYPGMKNQDAIRMVRDLSPDSSFTSTFQNMKEPVTACLYDLQLSDDLYWYLPAARNISRKRLYRMHMPQTSVVFPDEFQPLIDALPDADDYLQADGIDASHIDRDYNNDFAVHQALAELGDADGQYYTGVYYGTGDVVSQDYVKSREYFEKADRQGHIGATYQLGLYHLYGFGVEADSTRALSYLERAAAQGHADAAVVAAQMYHDGTHGVQEDHEKAFRLYMIAAEQGSEEAIWYVIESFLDGRGTEQDFDEAYKWLDKAMEYGYYNVVALAGGWFFYQGSDDGIDIALELLSYAAEQGNPLSFYFMGRIALLRYRGPKPIVEEALEWFVGGADYGEKQCIDLIRRHFPKIYEAHQADWEETVSRRNRLISLVQQMGSDDDAVLFITLVDAYRERWQHSYLKELCKQLRIHKSPHGNGTPWTPQRRIIVRHTTQGKSCYEIVLVTADGEQLPIKTFNANALVLYLLTIICSCKSGYTTEMVRHPDCARLIGRLVCLVFGEQFADKYLRQYMEAYMSSGMENSKYYRPYSKLAKDAVSKSLGMKDDPVCFLFDNTVITGRKNLRRMNMPPHDIELPDELADLAIRMPDALDILQPSDNQYLNKPLSE